MPPGAALVAVGAQTAAIFHAAGCVALNTVLRIVLRIIAQTLQTCGADAANTDKARVHIGAIAFIHRFGSSLNEHVHFHMFVVGGVFEEVAGHVVANFEPAAPCAIFP